ncbi:MAG: hypothetical protein WBH47_26470 [Streptosporangiaceae bacterium]
MRGTITLIDGQLLLFRFPYSPEINNDLRDATRVHWDPKLRGFALSADQLRRDPTMIAKLAHFMREHKLDPDAGIRKLFALRAVNPAGLAVVLQNQQPLGHGALSPGHLRCDLLPASTWGSNLRGAFSSEDWDALRVPVSAAARDICEVCGTETYMESGRKQRPDCHELWTFFYSRARNIQRLDRLIALCRDCHRAQHIGRAGATGETDLVIAKLCAVNGWTTAQALLEMNRAWSEYERRRRHRWDLDLSALKGAITFDGYPDLYFPAVERERLGNSYFR